MVKKILLKSRFDGLTLHSLYDEIIQNPPNGYLIEKEKKLFKNSNLHRFDNKNLHPLIRTFEYHVKPLPYIFKQKFQKFEITDFDLIFASQHLVFNSELPWITDLEFANALVAYGSFKFVKNIVKKTLSSKKCKFILPWSDWAKKTLTTSIDCSDFSEKIQVLRYTVKPKIFSKRLHEPINFLFVGSSNIMNYRNIQFKNLKEVILAFERITKKFDNVHLTIRSYLPPDLQFLVSKIPSITVIDSFLSSEELHDLYVNSDVFVLPSYETNGISLLDAMSFELPVIAMDIYDIPELISHQNNGIMIKPHKKMHIYTDNGSPNDYSWKFIKDINLFSEYIVDQLEEYFIKLIEDDSLRKNLGKNARKTIESGDFSLQKRNSHLKSIFDSSIN